MRLPAYAKALIAERRRGNHPWRVRLMLGEPWRSTTRHPWRLTPEPVVAIKTADWRARTVDWHCLRGAWVVIEDHGMLEFGELMTLAAEIAAVAAPVEVEALWDPPITSAGKDIRNPDIAYLAYGFRRCGRWPDWWSAAQDGDYRARASQWWGDFGLAIAQTAS